MGLKMRLVLTAAVCLSVSSNISPALAQSECSKDFKWYYAKYLTNKSQHYAVATFRGEPLKAYTVCAFAGEATKKLSEQKAMRVCNNGLKKYERKGKCKIIQSR
jgi:hypothetical protein